LSSNRDLLGFRSVKSFSKIIAHRVRFIVTASRIFEKTEQNNGCIFYNERKTPNYSNAVILSGLLHYGNGSDRITVLPPQTSTPMKKMTRSFFVLAASLTLFTLSASLHYCNGAETFTAHLRDTNKEGVAREFTEEWNPKETAFIVCDMWSNHPCAHAVARLKDLAVEMNTVFDAARKKGILIVFAPSSSSAELDKWYGKLPARTASAKYRHGYDNPRHWDFWVHGRGGEIHHSHLAFAGEKDAVKGFELPGGNTSCIVKSEPASEPQPPQVSILKIADTDIITDDFVEMIGGKYDGKEYKEYLFKERGIKNVILCGVHTDMCVIGRPFGCRALKTAGYNVVLARDLTDHTWNCDSRDKNIIDHYEGLDKIVKYIETYICPSITTTDITGKPAFKFDKTKYENIRPLVGAEAKKEIDQEKGKIKVEIVKAFYGVEETDGIDVTQKVKNVFEGTRLIPISDYNGTFTDPRGGIVKYLWITYTIDGKEKKQRFIENATILLAK
jgi:nicotinamidase-related amidase